MRRFAGSATAGLLLCSASASLAAQAPLLSRSDRPAWTSAESFTSISGLRELADGRVLVTDLSERQLYLIDRAGQRVSPVGRVGSGPGEYGAPTVLLPMPGDSTLLLDRDARRFLLIDPAGRIVVTSPFPPALTTAAPWLRGADSKGRLYFQSRAMSDNADGIVSLIRWDRQTGRTDSVATVRLPSPRPVPLPGGGSMRRIMPYTASDDWGVAPDGRIVLVRAEPYHVEWVGSDGSVGRSATIAASRVPVTDADKRANEPNAPPFRLEYPKVKPPFSAAYTVVDSEGRTVVMRSRAAGARTSQWDVIDATGKLLGTQQLPSHLRVLAITNRFLYVARTDSDDLRWLEAYPR